MWPIDLLGAVEGKVCEYPHRPLVDTVGLFVCGRLCSLMSMYTVYVHISVYTTSVIKLAYTYIFLHICIIYSNGENSH